RLGELVGEQPQAGNYRRPAPQRRPELEQFDRQRVARTRALDEHRPADRVHAREIDLGDVVRAGALAELFVGRVAGVQFDDVARIDLERRLDRVVPDCVVGVVAELVNRVRIHFARTYRGGAFTQCARTPAGQSWRRGVAAGPGFRVAPPAVGVIVTGSAFASFGSRTVTSRMPSCVLASIVEASMPVGSATEREKAP